MANKIRSSVKLLLASVFLVICAYSIDLFGRYNSKYSVCHDSKDDKGCNKDALGKAADMCRFVAFVLLAGSFGLGLTQNKVVDLTFAMIIGILQVYNMYNLSGKVKLNATLPSITIGESRVSAEVGRL